ncbi:MAG: hypothetical protein V3V92_01855 [Candidatus Hydrothermarchaeales archaeon]
MSNISYCYEIYLPLNYNNGGAVEHIKFKQTKDDLVKRFGGVTLAPLDKNLAYEGIWVDKGKTYVDRIVIARVITDVDEDDFYMDFKEVLEKRFHQKEIMITKHTVEKI